MNISMDYVLEKLEILLKTPSPTGNTEKAINFVENEFRTLGLTTKRTNKNALIATIEGKNKEKEITLSGHVDTLGGMVKEIKGNGRLKITQLGGYVWNTIEGEHVEIETLEGKKYTGTFMTTKASSHVHGEETETIKRNMENMEIRIDEIVNTAEDVKELGINVGDFDS